jgi:transcriptional antiterminator NusG
MLDENRDFHWFAVYTLPRCEAKANSGIATLGYATYLPTERRWIRHARYKKAEDRPLLARYLFVGFDPDRTSWSPIRKVDGVCDLVRSAGTPSRMSQADIDLVFALKASQMVGAFDQTSVIDRMQIGENVRIVAGPFAGFIGELCATNSAEKRAEIFVSMFGKQHTIRMEFEQLRPVA